jgi:hypothetical protein
VFRLDLFDRADALDLALGRPEMETDLERLGQIPLQPIHRNRSRLTQMATALAAPRGYLDTL